MAKLLPLEVLPQCLVGKVVLAHGCFDFLHPGHIEHLEQAKAMGDILVVTITADEFVNKGPGRPLFPQGDRIRQLAALECVDFVAVVEAPTALPALEIIKPAVYVKGPDYKDKADSSSWAEERAAVRKYGGQVRFTSGKTYSSSVLIARHFPRLPEEATEFVGKIKKDIGLAGVFSWLDRASKIRVAVLGEAIVDHYVFVSPEGKSRKDSIVCFKRVREESYAGGASAVWAHVTAVAPNAKEFLQMPPVVKTRYVLEPYMTKLFQVATVPELHKKGEYGLSGFDMALVADYGHGMFPDGDICRIVSPIPFLALCVQTNSLNYGFNLLTKWSRADYVVADEDEVRLACHDNSAPVAELAGKLRSKLGAMGIAVTQGHKGALVLSEAGQVKVPSLTDKVVDRLGAGDAFLGVTAPLACVGAPPGVLALVGSVAAAIEVGILGNKPVSGMALKRWLEALLK